MFLLFSVKWSASNGLNPALAQDEQVSFIIPRGFSRELDDSVPAVRASNVALAVKEGHCLQQSDWNSLIFLRKNDDLVFRSTDGRWQQK